MSWKITHVTVKYPKGKNLDREIIRIMGREFFDCHGHGPDGYHVNFVFPDRGKAELAVSRLEESGVLGGENV